MAALLNVLGILEDSVKPTPVRMNRKAQDLADVSITPEAAASQLAEIVTQSGFQMTDLVYQSAQSPDIEAIRDSLNIVWANQKIPVIMFGMAPGSRVSSQIIGEIDRLKVGAEDDEAIPTDFAYQNAHAVILSAYAQADPGRTVPRFNPIPWATTDDVGGIRVLWDFGTRKLRANFGASPQLKTYLYFASESESDSEALNAESLKSRLKWLTER
jgi:hypothetical protein